MYLHDQKPNPLFMGLIIVLMVSASAMHGFMVSGQTLHDDADATIFIDSSFKLWNPYEKMLNPKFNITILYFDIDNNHSCYYEIIVDENITSGMMQYHHFANFSITNRDSIGNLQVNINNQTMVQVYNIILIDGVNAESVSSGSKPFTINLKPSEWNEKEWNIFWSLVLSSVIALAISYLSVKHYRKKHGMVEIK